MLIINKTERVQKGNMLKVKAPFFPHQHSSHPAPTGKHHELFLVYVPFSNCVTHASIHTNIFVQGYLCTKMLIL